jgi:hypothetical protein
MIKTNAFFDFTDFRYRLRCLSADDTVAALATSSEGVSPEALAQHMVARATEEDGGWVMEGKLMHDNS